jgi:hypothetical protein
MKEFQTNAGSSKSLVIELVNLSGYAQSKSFIGYSESKREEYNSSDLIKLFNDYWGIKNIQKGYIVSSLTRSLLLEEIPSQIDEKLFQLEKKGWINLSLDNDEIDNNLQEFTLNYESQDAIDNILSLCVEGYTYGHLFFVWPIDGLIIYPHDDCGFGVLAKFPSEGYRIGINFLSFMQNEGNFNVFTIKTGFPLSS